MINLVIAAHPDDEVLGCGGIIRKLSQKEEVYVLILTDGSEGRYSNGMVSVLKGNAIDASKILRAEDVFFEGLPNQKLDNIPMVDITQVIEKYIGELKADRVFTHNIGDLNKDHQIVAEATFIATRPISGQIVREVYSYYVPSSTEWNMIEGEKVFVPNVFVDIEDEIDCKLNAMECYESECRDYPHPRSIRSIKANANHWGISSGIRYAEPLKLIRKLYGL